MTTAFGPQGANASFVRPAAQKRHASDTWVRDCSGTGRNDGTQINAQLYNTIIGNLRNAVRKSGVTLNDNNMDMLYEAIRRIAAKESANVVGGNGILVNAGKVSINWNNIDTLE